MSQPKKILNECYVHDSFTGLEYPEHRIWAISYEPDWQKVRWECHFTDDTYIRTFALLEGYVGQSQNIFETRNRLWRVYNFLNAVPLGQATKGTGIRKIRLHLSEKVINARREYRRRIDEVGKPSVWDWHDVRMRLTEMWLHDESEQFLLQLYQKLKWQRRGRSRPGGKPELEFFLKLIEETGNG